LLLKTKALLCGSDVILIADESSFFQPGFVIKARTLVLMAEVTAKILDFSTDSLQKSNAKYLR
jgi:hypothetical protein